jgi:hypothetical protein
MTMFLMAQTGTDGLKTGNQLLLAIANQIGTPHLPERIAQERPVLGIVIAQECLVQLAHATGSNRLDRF